LERAKGFEPSTSTLARLRSTPELRPQFKKKVFYKPPFSSYQGKLNIKTILFLVNVPFVTI
jgi:hypothetical protein